MDRYPSPPRDCIQYNQQRPIFMKVSCNSCYVYDDVSKTVKVFPNRLVSDNGRFSYGTKEVCDMKKLELKLDDIWLTQLMTNDPNPVSNKSIVIRSKVVSLCVELVLGLLFQNIRRSDIFLPKHTPNVALVSVPFWFTSLQRQQILSGLHIAGFREYHIFNENTIAAYNCFNRGAQNIADSTSAVVISNNDARIDVTIYERPHSNETKIFMTDHVCDYNVADTRAYFRRIDETTQIIRDIRHIYELCRQLQDKHQLLDEYGIRHHVKLYLSYDTSYDEARSLRIARRFSKCFVPNTKYSSVEGLRLIWDNFQGNMKTFFEAQKFSEKQSTDITLGTQDSKLLIIAKEDIDLSKDEKSEKLILLKPLMRKTPLFIGEQINGLTSSAIEINISGMSSPCIQIHLFKDSNGLLKLARMIDVKPRLPVPQNVYNVRVQTLELDDSRLEELRNLIRLARQRRSNQIMKWYGPVAHK